jgi:hypothetical protein
VPILGRHGAEWWRARDACLRGATICHMPHCRYPGQPLVHGGSRKNPLRATADHIVQVRMMEGWTETDKRRVLNDPTNLRPAHAACNSARNQNPERARPAQRHTRDWGV